MASALQYLQPLDSPSASPGHSQVSWSGKEIKKRQVTAVATVWKAMDKEASSLPPQPGPTQPKCLTSLFVLQEAEAPPLTPPHPQTQEMRWEKLGNLKGPGTLLKYPLFQTNTQKVDDNEW